MKNKYFFAFTLLVTAFSSRPLFADELSTYFDGWCGTKNLSHSSIIGQVCHAERITHEPIYKVTNYLVVFGRCQTVHYELSDFKFLKDDKTKASATLTDPIDGKKSTFTMDWHYEVPTYPGESVESYPATIKGQTPDGQAFDFEDLKSFYNGPQH